MKRQKDAEDKTGMNDTQLRDETLTIFLAGYETVANALTWTWYLLSENPTAADRMYAEVAEVLGIGADSARDAVLEDFARLKYTEKVFAESMRLYPPAWAMGRQSTQPVELGPYRIPAGSHISSSASMLSSALPSTGTIPDTLPPRALQLTKPRPLAPKFAYFPFGGGRRQCIGESFAWMEGVLSASPPSPSAGGCASCRSTPSQAKAKITLRPKVSDEDARRTKLAAQLRVPHLQRALHPAR